MGHLPGEDVLWFPNSVWEPENVLREMGKDSFALNLISWFHDLTKLAKKEPHYLWRIQI
jgi:hypothetical protein